MALVLPPMLLLLEPNIDSHFPTFTCHLKPSFQHRTNPQVVLKHSISRRVATSALMSSLLLARDSVFNANAFDFRMTVPDQTVEEAESGIRGHAQSLLQVKSLLESSLPETWKEAQKALRKRASYLKQDLYTIIQSKPGSERPQLRKLYSNLFNNVTGLDYAARDKDTTRVWECYGNIVVALNDILSRI